MADEAHLALLEGNHCLPEHAPTGSDRALRGRGRKAMIHAAPLAPQRRSLEVRPKTAALREIAAMIRNVGKLRVWVGAV